MRRAEIAGVLVITCILLLATAGCTSRREVPCALVKVSATSGPAPLDVEFDGSLSFDPNGHIVVYSWEFGDGTEVTCESASTPLGLISHTYENVGWYAVALTVIDNQCLSDTFDIFIEVTSEPPVAVFTVLPESGGIPLDVSFDGTYSFDPDGSITDYVWDYGDGETASGAVTSHTYAIPGYYIASLTVIDGDGNVDSTARAIIVDPVVVYDSVWIDPAPPRPAQPLN